MSNERDKMPRDPWAEEGVDLWTLEKAEEMTANDVDPASAQWDDIDGPTIEEFDQAAAELDRDRTGRAGSGPLGLMRPWLGLIAAVVVLAFVLTYVLR